MQIRKQIPEIKQNFSGLNILDLIIHVIKFTLILFLKKNPKFQCLNINKLRTYKLRKKGLSYFLQTLDMQIFLRGLFFSDVGLLT